MTQVQRSISIVVLLTLSLLAAIAASIIWFFSSQPAWQLTVRNIDYGIKVIVTKEGSPDQVFAVEIIGAKVSAPFENLTRNQISSTEVRTLFYDDTLRPGDWKVFVGDTTIEFWPAGITVNGTLNGSPGETITVDPATRFFRSK